MLWDYVSFRGPVFSKKRKKVLKYHFPNIHISRSQFFVRKIAISRLRTIEDMSGTRLISLFLTSSARTRSGFFGALSDHPSPKLRSTDGARSRKTRRRRISPDKRRDSGDDRSIFKTSGGGATRGLAYFRKTYPDAYVYFRDRYA